MNYKKSFYNVIIEELEENKKLIYNTYSGIYGVMDGSTQLLYDDIENIDLNSVIDKKDMKNIDIMKKAGYIVPVNSDELVALRLKRAKSKYDNNRLHLTIAPTLDCNMCCPYCYEDKNKSIMSKEVQNELINFVKRHLDTYPNIKDFSVTWYGGEPLLQKEIIYYLSQEFIKICSERQITYMAGMITNGVLLNREIAEYLVNNCRLYKVQITVDGMRERHNKSRILISGADSFGIIMKNIEDCKDILSIYIRTNVDKKNMKEIEELTRYFLQEKNFVKNPRFYLAPVENHSKNEVHNKNNYLDIDEFVELDTNFIRFCYTHNQDNMAKELFPKGRNVFCAAEEMLTYVIDPDGDYYTCWLRIGNKECSIGNICNPFTMTSEYGKWLFMDLHEKCERCKYLPLCQGGCAANRMDKGGEPQCPHSFYTYKEKLKLAYKDYELKKA